MPLYDLGEGQLSPLDPPVSGALTWPYAPRGAMAALVTPAQVSGRRARPRPLGPHPRGRGALLCRMVVSSESSPCPPQGIVCRSLGMGSLVLRVGIQVRGFTRRVPFLSVSEWDAVW